MLDGLRGKRPMECPVFWREEIGRQVTKTQSRKGRVGKHLDVKRKDN